MLSSFHMRLQLNCGHYNIMLIHVFVNLAFVFNNFNAFQYFKRRYGVFLEANLIKRDSSECYKTVHVNIVLNCESTNQFI